MMILKSYKISMKGSVKYQLIISVQTYKLAYVRLRA